MAKRSMPLLMRESKPVVEEVPPAQKGYVKMIVANCKRANLREAPDKEAKIITELPIGTKLTAETPEWEWVHVQLYDDPSITGYIMRRLTEEV